MADSLALTFGSDLSGNSNIATISIASHVTFGSSTSPRSVIGYSDPYTVTWPPGATHALVRPTFYPSSRIIISGVCVIDNTMNTGPISSIAVTTITISSSPGSGSTTAYVYSYNQRSVCIDTNGWSSNGWTFNAIYIFF